METLDHFRSWHGPNDGQPYWTWKEIPTRAKDAGIRVHGHFEDGAALHDAKAGRRALLLLAETVDNLNGVLLIRDDDGDDDRENGLDQARTNLKVDFPIVVGLAHVKRECWVLNGFEPCDDKERESLEAIRKELGFYPRLEPHRLTHRGKGELRNAKTIVTALTGDIEEREQNCWQETRLDVLEQRGEHTGLKKYLNEIRKSLIPLFTGTSAQ
ncbi:MAG: hypothetical protein ACFCD0_19530 [Gemmataceae bacterium]